MFPININQRRFESAKALADTLAAAATGPSHRAHAYPAEAFIEARREPTAARALAAACELLVRESSEPSVLLLCAQLGGADHLPFYRAVLRRLKGEPPLPSAPGASEPTLAGELATTLARPAVAAEPALFQSVVETLSAHGPVDALILVLDGHDPRNQLAAVLASAVRGERGPVAFGSFKLAAWSVAKRQPETLMDLARELRRLSDVERAALVETVSRANASWWQAHGASFERVIHGAAP